MIGSIWSLRTSCRSEIFMRTSESPRRTRLSERRRRVFARIGGGAQAVPAPDADQAPVTIAQPARRVLPDLLAAAREEERVSIRLPKTKRAGTRTPTTRRTEAHQQPVSTFATPGVEQEGLPVAVP